MDLSSSDLRINSNRQKEIEVNNNNNGDRAEKETNGPSTSSANTPAPRSGGEVSEFHSVEDISISRNNSQTNQDRIENSVTDKTVCNNSVQTEFPQILTPLPQRKWERDYAIAKPNKFRKIDSYFKNASSIQLNRQLDLEQSLQDLSLNDHERNINSQEVRETINPRLLDWPEINLSWSKSNEMIHSTPIRPQNNSGPKKQLDSVTTKPSIRDLQMELNEAIHRIRQEAKQQNSNVFNVNVLELFQYNSKPPNLLSVQQRLNVPIYEPAKANWRQLRSLQSRKVQLTLRNQYYEKLISEEAYLD